MAAELKKNKAVQTRLSKMKQLRKKQAQVSKMRAEIRALRVEITDIDIRLFNEGLLASMPTMCW